MPAVLFSLAKQWMLWVFIYEEWPYCCVFPSTAENKQLKTSSGRWFLCTWFSFCLQSIHIFSPRMMPLTLAWSLVFLSRLLWELLGLFCHFTLRQVPRCPSLCSADLFGGGFPLPQSSLSMDNLRLVTSSQNGRWPSCPAASFRWQQGANWWGASLLRDFRSQKWEVVCWCTWQRVQNLICLLHYHDQCNSLAKSNLNWMACKYPACSQTQFHSKNFFPSLPRGHVNSDADISWAGQYCKWDQELEIDALPRSTFLDILV